MRSEDIAAFPSRGTGSPGGGDVLRVDPDVIDARDSASSAGCVRQLMPKEGRGGDSTVVPGAFAFRTQLNARRWAVEDPACSKGAGKNAFHPSSSGVVGSLILAIGPSKLAHVVLQ